MAVGNVIENVGQAIGYGSATSAIDSAIGLGSQLLMNKIQYDQQNELMDKSYKQQMDFWNEQNAYNDPSAQIRRLRQAGLNPAMLNGNAVNNQAGGLSSVASPSAPNAHGVQPNTAGAMQALASVLKMSQESNFIDSQNSVLAQELFNKILEGEIKQMAKDTGLTEQEIKNMEREELYQFIYGEPSPGQKPLTSNRLVDAKNKVIAETKLAEENAAKAEAEKNEAISKSMLAQAQVATELAMKEPRVALARAQAANQDAQAQDAYASANLKIQQGKLVESQAEREAFIRAAEAFYGFVITGMDLYLAKDLLQNFSDVESGKMTPQAALSECNNLLNTYTNIHWYSNVSSSDSSSWSVDLFGLGFGGSKSESDKGTSGAKRK